MNNLQIQNESYLNFINWFKKFNPISLAACLNNHERKEKLFNKFKQN